MAICRFRSKCGCRFVSLPFRFSWMKINFVHQFHVQNEFFLRIDVSAHLFYTSAFHNFFVIRPDLLFLVIFFRRTLAGEMPVWCTCQCLKRMWRPEIAGSSLPMHLFTSLYAWLLLVLCLCQNPARCVRSVLRSVCQEFRIHWAFVYKMDVCVWSELTAEARHEQTSTTYNLVAFFFKISFFTSFPASDGQLSSSAASQPEQSRGTRGNVMNKNCFE